MSTTYAEVFARASGSNLNGGGLSTRAEPGTSAAYTSTNGNWSTVTNKFTPTDGTTPASSVNVGDYASIYIDGASVAVYIARVTVVAAGANGAITVSTTAALGAVGVAPVTSATTRTIKVGGAWLGPNAASGFPFTLTGFGAGQLQDASGNMTRFNMKNDQTYSITAAVTESGGQAGWTYVEGYSSTAGDTGRATWDGGSGTSYTMLTASLPTVLRYLQFQSNGSSGSSMMVDLGARSTAFRCVFKSSRGQAIRLTSSSKAIECEAYSCNASNTANLGAFNGQGLFIRCIAHDNSGSNNVGFYNVNGNFDCIECIADTNGKYGFQAASGAQLYMVRCIAYGNGGSGVGYAASASSQELYIESCIFANNTGYGVELGNAVANPGYARLQNCAYFGNTTAPLLQNTTQLEETGNINLSAAPFVDAANGDFRLNTAETIFAGAGSFYQTQGSYGNANVIGYSDVGAVQRRSEAAFVSGG